MTRRPVHDFARTARRDGFTLLELCVVLLIIALLAGAAMPAMESAFTEQALRTDSHQLSLIVKTAMLTSSEQQRPYVISLDGGDLLLQPAPAAAQDADDAPASSTHDGDEADAPPPPEDVTMEQKLGNALKLPDAEKKNAWETLPAVRWTFQPNGLCPLPRVRFERGSAYIEMSFNALTGDVENESSYLP